MLEKEDFIEPRCLLCMNKKEIIPIDRVLVKLDGYLYKEEFESAKSLLEYWIKEAESIEDYRGKLALYNESMGLYRKINEREKAIFFAKKSLEILDVEEIKGTTSVGTTYLNVATVYKAFSQVEKSIEFYRKAEKIYDQLLRQDDVRKSGLYNNYALALGEIGELESAEKYFFRALNIVENNENSKIECAITYCNLCDLQFALNNIDSDKKIKLYLEKAKYYIESENIRNCDYAYAISKCASAFSNYGDKEYAVELERRARSIYEGA